MTRTHSDLSKTEWLIMNICWEKGKSSARDIYEETLRKKERGYQTVKTMLDRLVAKGYLTREKFGPIWLYDPAVQKEDIVENEIDSFADRVLGNTIAPLFAHLAKKERLSTDEIQVLKNLINQHEEEL